MIKTKNKRVNEAIEFVWLLTIVFLVRTFVFGLYQVPSGSMETTMLVGERFYADKFSYAFLTMPEYGDVIAFNDPCYKYSENPLKRWIEYYVWGPSNWTKRVIGKPGDHIQGVIEDDKPVVYRNGEKLDEPYLNRYPLIGVFKENPSNIISQLDTMARKGFDQQKVSKMLDQAITFKSYDPNVPFQNQSFYRIDPLRIVINPITKQPEIKNPGEPIAPASNMPVRKNIGTCSDEFDVHLAEDQYWVMGDNRRNSGDSRFFGPIHRKNTYIHAKIIYRIWSIDSDAWFWLFDLLQNPVDFFNRVRWSRFFARVH